MQAHGKQIVASRTPLVAGVVVGALLVAVVTLWPPGAAQATDGDIVHVGQAASGSSGAAAIWAQASSTGDGINTAASADTKSAVYAHNDGKGYGVFARANSLPAVYGWNTGDGDGLHGLSVGGSGAYGYSVSGAGIWGYSLDSSGVFGQSHGAGDGLHGESIAGTGAFGSSTSGAGVDGESANSTGVLGRSQTSGAGVWGVSTSGTGVAGVSTSGAGVVASSTSGPALVVHGTAQLATAGRAKVKKGFSLAKVTGVSVGTNSGILATLMGNAGVYVKYAYRTSATSFTVVFSGKATKSVKFAYFVVN